MAHKNKYLPDSSNQVRKSVVQEQHLKKANKKTFEFPWFKFDSEENFLVFKANKVVILYIADKLVDVTLMILFYLICRG